MNDTPDRPDEKPLTRRQFVRLSLALPAPIVLAACASATLSPTQPAPETPNPILPTQPAPTPLPLRTEPPSITATPATEAPAVLPPTPACGEAEPPTLAQTEGPFYTPDTPERASFLEPGLSGARLVVSGQVLTTDCRPVSGALLDFWHADDAGVYDNAGYRLRGHQFADEQGRYSLETILPGLYPGRTRHIHVKVQAPNQPVLTTQMYFPGEPGNASDGIYRPELLMDVQESEAGRMAAFDFVLEIA